MVQYSPLAQPGPAFSPHNPSHIQIYLTPLRLLHNPISGTYRIQRQPTLTVALRTKRFMLRVKRQSRRKENPWRRTTRMPL